jgi:ribosomal protein S18 acetylase RimI-like enzyme
MTETTWTIAPKTAANVDGSVALLAEVAQEGHTIATMWPFDMGARARVMRGALADGAIDGFVAYDGGRVVGDFSIFQPDTAEPSFGMTVAASHRRRGIGRALIERAIAWSAERGKSALRLRVFPDNAPARALYAATGFVEIELQRDSVALADGTLADAILMRRPIAPA